jgi:hypothetical protein
MTPQELVVYWTEYTVRNDGARYMTPSGVNMPLYKHLMWDILAIILLVASYSILVIYLTTRKLLSPAKNRQKPKRRWVRKNK